MTVLAAIAGWFAAGRVLRPVHRITEAARNASEEYLVARVALTGPRDELRELADIFDAMLDRLESSFEGRRRFIANAGRELRTPLTVMRTSVEVVLAKPDPTRVIEERLRITQPDGADAIAVDVQNGVAILDGLTSSPQGRQAVAALAWSTPGVRDVCDRLRTVSTDGQPRQADTEPFDQLVAGAHPPASPGTLRSAGSALWWLAAAFLVWALFRKKPTRCSAVRLSIP